MILPFITTPLTVWQSLLDLFQELHHPQNYLNHTASYSNQYWIVPFDLHHTRERDTQAYRQTLLRIAHKIRYFSIIDDNNGRLSSLNHHLITELDINDIMVHYIILTHHDLHLFQQSSSFQCYHSITPFFVNHTEFHWSLQLDIHIPDLT